MIKVATILPTPLLETRVEDMYHMCLFHMVRDNAFYAKFFKEQKQQGAFVIMDNGAAEGVNPTAEELMEVYKIVEPSEIVLPDVVYDKEETLKRTKDAYSKFRANNLHHLYQFMAVPQGNTFAEWTECLIEMLQQPNITTIGVSKFVTPKFQDEMGDLSNVRLECVDMILIQAKKLHREIQIHLLGCWDSPTEIGQISEVFSNEVRGTDSAIAYVFTRAGELVQKINKRPDNLEIDFNNGTIENMELLKHNVDGWIAYCNNL